MKRSTERLGRMGFVARFKPVHVGDAVMIASIVARADAVRIAIGSSNTYDMRNPFTAVEAAERIALVRGDQELVEAAPGRLDRASQRLRLSIDVEQIGAARDRAELWHAPVERLDVPGACVPPGASPARG